MERTGDGRSLAVNTREMREICREAHRRGLNRKVTPAQFKLLDPKGTHILSPLFMHDRADGKKVEPHMRCDAYLKLLGKQAAIESTLDIPMQFLRGQMSQERLNEAIEKGIAIRAMQEDTMKDNVVDEIEAISADVRARAEGNA
jgi:hypothetical protein